MKSRAILLSLLVAVAAAAQHRENVTVEVIEVPVYVIAPDGTPVRGLTKDAFELRVNGRRQPIEYFDAIDLTAPHPRRTEPALARPARERRLYLLLFDLYYSLPNALSRARQAARYAVDHADPETDFFAVATYTSTKGVQFATAFLNDRLAIQRAIDTLRPSELAEPLAIATSPAERAAIASDERHGLDPQAELADMVGGGAAFQDLMLDEQRHRIEEELGNFGDIASRLSRLEGQKHVLWLSAGFSADLVHGGRRAVPASVFGGGGADARSVRILDEMAQSFAAAGVILDSVDIAGLRHTFAQGENEGLAMVARATGGEFVHNRNDLGNAMVDLQNLQRVTYLLGFNRRSNKSGEITVRVNGVPRGSRLSYRQGFGKASPATSVDPLQLADIVTNDVPQNGIAMKLELQGKELVCALDKAEITPQVDPKKPFVDVFVYVFDASGAAVFTKNAQLDVRTDALVLRERLDLPPGRYVAKAVSVLEGTASTGFVRQSVTIE